MTAAMKLEDASNLDWQFVITKKKKKKKTLAPWKKNYHQPTRILKSRDITLPTKVFRIKAMVFPVVM